MLMRKIFLTLLIVCVGLTALCQATAIAIKDVAVIDVRTGAIKSKQTVIIEGNKITSVTSNSVIPKTVTVIDGSGKYLIPGLSDMHIHCFTDSRYEWVFPLLIANGVTSVREMGNNLSFEQIKKIRQSLLEGKMEGPRIGATTARIFEGPGQTGIANVSVQVDSVDKARRLVKEYKQQGMDFIKPYNLLPRDIYLAIIDEAKRQKIPVAGHVPYAMTAAEVSKLGQITIEHLTDIPMSCSADETILRKELDALPDSVPFAARQPIEIKALPSFDEQKAKTLFRRFVNNHTWICPTAVVYVGGTREEQERLSDKRLEYIPVSMQEQWRRTMKQRTAYVENIEQRKIRFHKRAEINVLMYRAGVGILAGSDAPNPYVIPGFSLHDELELFVQTGLTPLEALQTATINAAKFLHKEKEIGTIAKGMYADLVLLEGNPLDNISNTQKIHGVVLNGRWLDRKKLDAILEEVKALVKNK